MNRKGQSYSIELIIFTTFLTGLILFFIYFVSYMYRMDFEERGKVLSNEIVEFLTLSPGSPRNWEEIGNVSVPGIADRRNVIDYKKLNALNQTNYSEVLRTYLLEVRISIISNGTTVYQIGNITNSKTVYVSERACVLKNTSLIPCLLKIEIGEK